MVSVGVSIPIQELGSANRGGCAQGPNYDVDASKPGNDIVFNVPAHLANTQDNNTIVDDTVKNIQR